MTSSSPSRKSEIEWAVISLGFRGATYVYKDGLGSKAEAQAWLHALTMTQERTDREYMMMTDGIMMRDDLVIAWREKPTWTLGDPPEEQA